MFRLNIGLSNTYRAQFGPQPPRPSDGGAVDTGHDFTVLDQLFPHPCAPQSWVSVLNPSAETFEAVQPLLAEAYDLAVNRISRRTGAPGAAAERG